jgi:hypothetical protein
MGPWVRGLKDSRLASASASVGLRTAISRARRVSRAITIFARGMRSLPSPRCSPYRKSTTRSSTCAPEKPATEPVLVNKQA